jgi:hypothetical protein
MGGAGFAPGLALVIFTSSSDLVFGVWPTLDARLSGRVGAGSARVGVLGS